MTGMRGQYHRIFQIAKRFYAEFIFGNAGKLGGLFSKGFL